MDYIFLGHVTFQYIVHALRIPQYYCFCMHDVIVFWALSTILLISRYIEHSNIERAQWV